LILRAGIAGALAQKEQALAYADIARSIRFEDRVLQAENAILIGSSLSRVLEVTGDINGAVAELHEVLDLYRSYDDLVANGSLVDNSDIALLGLGLLYLEQNELDLAQQALAIVRKMKGDSSDVLFAMSELERKKGNDTQALNYYQQALRLRKTGASEMSIIFGTNRRLEPSTEPAHFGGEAGEHVSLGEAVVLVPGGEFSSESWLKPSRQVPIPVGMATNPNQLVIRSKKILSVADFGVNVRRSIVAARLYPKSALVFVHGYNVTFDEALRRAAQLVRDLNYDSTAFVLSWPSKGDWWQYGTDRASASKAVESLVDFLGMVEIATAAEEIHVIAHSMGNRVLLPALLRIAGDAKGTLRPRIGEVIFAAPAVPETEFIKWIDELARRGLDRFTLYASAGDKALMVGSWREGATTLAGRVATGEPLMHANVQSVDVSEAGSDVLVDLNHDIFASNPVVSEDIRQLLQNGIRPPHNHLSTLEKRSSKTGANSYWYYRR
jgi:esterase/lipase superfamily enzyme